MPLIIPSNSISGEFEIANSLRFDDGSSDNLTKTFGTDGTSHDIGTVSVWLKRSELGAEQGIFTAGSSGRNFIRFESGDNLTFRSVSDGFHLQTTQVFRDPSAWYHIVIAFDTTQGTSSNRIKMYVNGSQITSFSTETYPSQNLDIKLGAGELNAIGKDSEQTNPYYDGYMSEFVYIDGQQLDPTSFGEFDEDSGIWKPISISGLTFGTNGFYLDFENSGSLGADVSGNGNNFTVNNLTSIDQSTDTPTNNFATMNPLLVTSSTPSFSEGNLAITTSALSTWQSAFSTIAVTQGKWYCEIEFESGQDVMLGIVKESSATNSFTAGSNYPGINSGGYGYYEPDGSLYNNGSASSYGNSYTTGDIIGIALDLDNNYLYFSKNGTFQNSGDPTSGATGTGGIDISSITSEPIYIASGHWKTVSGTTTTFSNFGNPPFTISSGNSDGNGYGNFEYAVPTNFFSYCSKNLAEYG